MRKIVLGLVGLILSGCATVTAKAAFDFQCPEDQIKVTRITIMGGNYGAQGCGKQASYIVDHTGNILMSSPIQEIVSKPANNSEGAQTQNLTPELNTAKNAPKTN